MNTNFDISDPVTFHIPNPIDVRRECELLSVEQHFGFSREAKITWRILGSNNFLSFEFHEVFDFIALSRDLAYPPQSGISLAITGFCGPLSSADSEFFVNARDQNDYLAFVMDDRSAYLISAVSCEVKIT